MPSPFLASLLHRGHPLAARILDFHRYPASYAQPGWIPEEWAETARLPGRRARARVSAMLQERLRIPAGPLDFELPGARLALVDPPALQRAAYLAGLAAHAPEMAALLERGRVLELRMQLSRAEYGFVLHKARLLTGAEIPSRPAVTAGAIAGRTNWKQRAGRSGLLLLGACFAGAAESLRARLKLKFPPAAAPVLAAGAAGAAGEAVAAVPARVLDWRLFRKILLQEVDDSWAPLFS